MKNDNIYQILSIDQDLIGFPKDNVIVIYGTAAPERYKPEGKVAAEPTSYTSKPDGNYILKKCFTFLNIRNLKLPTNSPYFI